MSYLNQFEYPEPKVPTTEEIEQLIENEMLLSGMPASKINASKKEIMPQSKQNKKTGDVIPGLWSKIAAALRTNGSLFLFGAVGSGKTCILSCIMREYIRSGKKSIRYISIYDFALQVSKCMEDHFNYARYLEELLSYDILMLDDIGAGGLNDSQKTALIFLLNKIEQQGSQLIISSNCDVKDIDEHFDERIGSRLKEKCVYFKLEGKDRRGKK